MSVSVRKRVGVHCFSLKVSNFGVTMCMDVSPLTIERLLSYHNINNAPTIDRPSISDIKVRIRLIQLFVKRFPCIISDGIYCYVNQAIKAIDIQGHAIDDTYQ